MVAGMARSGDLVITMGAGDITVLAPEILLELLAMTRTAPARPVRRAPEIYRRRRLAAAVVVVSLLGALALVVRVVLYDSHLFDVQGVQVEGISMLPETDVVAAAAVPIGAPLASIDTAASRTGSRSCPRSPAAVVAGPGRTR